MTCSALDCSDGVHTVFLGFAVCEVHYLEMVFLAQMQTYHIKDYLDLMMGEITRKLLSRDATVDLPHLYTMTSSRPPVVDSPHGSAQA